MTATTPDTALTRAEAAYAHLADFAKGAEIAIRTGSTTWCGVVMTPLRDNRPGTTGAYLTVRRAGGKVIRPTVADLLSGRYQIAGEDDAADGYWPRFGVAVITSDGMLVEYPAQEGTV